MYWCHVLTGQTEEEIQRRDTPRAVTTIEDTEVMSSVFFSQWKKKEGDNCRQIVNSSTSTKFGTDVAEGILKWFSQGARANGPWGRHLKGIQP